MFYTPREIAEELDLPEKTLRDWLTQGAPHSRDERDHLWVDGRQFAAWVEAQRQIKRQSHGKLKEGEGYCLRCNQIVQIENPVVCHIKGKLITSRASAQLVDALSIVEAGMIERQNYLKVKLFLKYLEEIQQVSLSSLERHSFYLRHLLLWADDRSLGDSPTFRPTLQAYTASTPGKDGHLSLAFESQKKIIEISKRFLSGPKRLTQEIFHVSP